MAAARGANVGMKVVVSGGRGFIGGVLCRALAARGDDVVVLTRRAASAAAGVRLVPWQPGVLGPWVKEVDGADAVVNLAGASIAGQRWTPAYKHRILGSRIDATSSLVEAMRRAARRPALLISASAVGYYGPHGGEELTERDGPGHDFLATTCQQWEHAAQAAEGLGVRVVRLRIGLVLAVDGRRSVDRRHSLGSGDGAASVGGALAKMLPIFTLGLGGPVGSGSQWVSWIQRDDLVGLLLFLLTCPDAAGAVNATAQNPVTMRDFSTALGHALGRPAMLPAPAPAVRFLLGEMADLLLTGQRVIPTAAVRMGFAFRYPTLPEALAASLQAAGGGRG